MYSVVQKSMNEYPNVFCTWEMTQIGIQIIFVGHFIQILMLITGKNFLFTFTYMGKQLFRLFTTYYWAHCFTKRKSFPKTHHRGALNLIAPICLVKPKTASPFLAEQKKIIIFSL